MSAMKGYYSLIQFCPDISRLETVNVGVVLLCPDASFIASRISNDNRRAEKLVGKSKLDKESLSRAKKAIHHRFQVDRGAFRNLEDLQVFAESRGNDLILTAPRPVKVFDPDKDLNRLFDSLVDVEVTGHIFGDVEEQKFGGLRSAFETLHRTGRAEIDKELIIPVVNRKQRFDYAFQNGSLNLVNTCSYPKTDSAAIKRADEQAVLGDLIHRFMNDGNGEPDKLTIVSAFHPATKPSTRMEVRNLLNLYHVNLVPEEEVSQFIKHVKKAAH